MTEPKSLEIGRSYWRFWLAGVLTCVLLTYANAFDNTFHFDDFHTVNDNPAVRSLTNIPQFFLDTTTFSVLPANRTYRPIVTTSLAIDYFLGRGYTPFWFHFGTMLLFLLLVVFVIKLAETIYERTTGSGVPQDMNRWLALVAGAWFGLHPVIAETVNYIIQRGDLYCTLGCVAALIIYARRPTWKRYGVYLLPLAIALLSKPPSAIFPLLLFAYILLFEEQEPRAESFKRAGVDILPSLAVVVAGLALQNTMTPKTYTPTTLSAVDYRITQPFVCLRYFGELFLPIHLNVDTDLTAFSTMNGEALLGLLFAGVLLAAVWFCCRHRALRPLAFGLIWFVLTQLPTSAYPLSEVENDHRMFFSFAGLIPGVVWGIGLTIMRMRKDVLLRSRRTLIASVMLVLCAYAWGTRVRNNIWHTEESLWWDDVQKSPKNGRGLMIYGLTQMNQGRYDRAMEYFTQALKFTPNYPTLELNLGVCYGVMGNPHEAEAHFLRAIALAPSDDQGHSFYAHWLGEQGRGAEANLQQAIAHSLNPIRAPQASVTAVSPAISAINLSMARYQARDWEGAISEAKRALDVDPNSAAAWNNIGASLAREGKWREAADADRKAIALDGTMQLARNNLAEAETHLNLTSNVAISRLSYPELLNRSMAQYQAGQFDASIQSAQRALRVNPQLAEAWNNIAAANASMKRWDTAIDAAKKAIALKPDLQLAKNNLAWALSEKDKAHAGK